MEENKNRCHVFNVFAKIFKPALSKDVRLWKTFQRARVSLEGRLRVPR